MATASAPQGSAPPEKKQTPSAMRSVLAGSTAGAVEIAITYPAECTSQRTHLPTEPVDFER